MPSIGRAGLEALKEVAVHQLLFDRDRLIFFIRRGFDFGFGRFRLGAFVFGLRGFLRRLGFLVGAFRAVSAFVGGLHRRFLDLLCLGF